MTEIKDLSFNRKMRLWMMDSEFNRDVGSNINGNAGEH